MNDRDAIDVIVLAGDRGPGDPLARAAGVSGKTLVPVAGRAMLTRVLDTLSAWPGCGRIILLSPGAPDYLAAIDCSRVDADRLLRVDPEPSPSQSVAAAIAAAQVSDRERLMLVTADHPLLRHAWLDRMAPDGVGARDFRVGVVDWALVAERFPDNRRTRYRFSDRSICGTNLFEFSAAAGRSLVASWRTVEQQRKRPWRIVALLGWANLGRYLTGRLDMASAFGALSDRLGIGLAPVSIDDPLAAVDVDSPADLALVEPLLVAPEPGQ